MKRIAFPCLCLLLLAVTSCRRDTAVRSALARAEAVMEENPREARQILDSIIVSRKIVISEEIIPKQSSEEHSSTHYSLITNHSKKDLAHYAWLKTQADYKCDVPLRSDSLARIATDYYGVPRRPDYHAAMAWYTLGCAYMDMQEDLRSIDAFLKAKPLFPDTLNRYYSLCLQNLGKLYTGHHMYSEAEEYLRAFKHICIERNDSVLMTHADYLLGKFLMWDSRFDEADKSFDAVNNNRFTKQLYRHRVLFQKAKIYLHHKHDCDSALYFINAYLSGTADEPFAGLSVKGDIFRSCGELDSAFACYKAAASDGAELYTQCNAYRCLAELSSTLKKEEGSLPAYMGKYALLIDSIYKQTQHEEINTLIRRQEYQLQKAKEASARRTWIFLNLLAALILLLLYLVRRTGKLRAETRWQGKKTAIKLEAVEKNAIPEELSETEDVVAINTTPPASVLETRNALVELCRVKFSSEKWNRLYSPENLSGTMDEKQLQELKRTLNKLMDDLQSQLSDDCLNLTRDDIYVCCLTMLGLSKKGIAYCFNTSEHAVSCRYTRLQKKLTPVWRQLVFPREEKGETL